MAPETALPILSFLNTLLQKEPRIAAQAA